MVTWFLPAAVMEPSALMLPDMMRLIDAVVVSDVDWSIVPTIDVTMVVVVGERCGWGGGYRSSSVSGGG